VLAVFGIGLLLRAIYLACAGEQTLVTLVPDDAFYYLKTARNIAAGLGSTFDGVHPTNGYHPLWMGLLLPAAALAPSPLALVRVALAMGTALSFLTALVLYRLVRRATAIWYIPLLALILFFLNPRAVASSLNGLETCLSTFLFTLVLALVLSEAGGTTRGRGRGFEAALGLLLGLLFLARTDNVFFVAAFYAAAVALAERPVRWRRAAVMAALAAVVAAPWLAWSWARFGSPVQVSGLSVPWVHHELFRLEGHTALQAVGHGIKIFLVLLWEGLRGEIGYPRAFSATAILLSLIVFAVRWRDPGCTVGMRRSALVLLGVAAASLAQTFVHSAIRWYPRPWYFDQLMVFLPVVFALAFALFEPGQTVPRAVRLLYPAAAPLNAFSRGLLGLALVGVVAVPTACSVQTLARGDWPWAREMLAAAHWLRDNTPRDAVAASFNAGIIGYFSGRRVVNLDGSIDNAAYAALRHRELMAFMERSGVGYYLDFEPMTTESFGPFFGPLAMHASMKVIHEIVLPGADWEGSNIRIHKIGVRP